MRRELGVVAVVVAAAIARPALADGTRARLVASDQICNSQALRARVVELLAQDPFDPGAATTVLVGIERRDGGVLARIAVRDPDGTERGRRTIEAAGCDAMVESVALVIALVLSQPEPAAAVVPPVVAVAPPVAPPPLAPVVTDAVGADIVATVDRSRRAHVELSAGVAGGAAGTGVSGAILIGADVRRRARSLGLEAMIAAPDQVAVGPGRVAVSTASVELAPCLHAGSLAACATLAGGWVRGRGVDLADARTATTPFAAVGSRIAWEHGLAGRAGIRLQLGVRVPLTRNRFLVDQMAVWSTQRVEAWLGFSVVTQIL